MYRVLVYQYKTETVIVDAIYSTLDMAQFTMDFYGDQGYDVNFSIEGR